MRHKDSTGQASRVPKVLHDLQIDTRVGPSIRRHASDKKFAWSNKVRSKPTVQRDDNTFGREILEEMNIGARPGKMEPGLVDPRLRGGGLALRFNRHRGVDLPCPPATRIGAVMKWKMESNSHEQGQLNILSGA